MSAATERERELAIRRDMFVRALAEFVGGPNQGRMSIALGMPGGQLKAVAELWSAIRTTIPGVFGYRSVEEAEVSIRDFLGWPK